jgi:2-methylisocitrate lyase-like PEP mutase family enzyme
MARPSIDDKRKTFRRLHENGCFVIPNPWNVGSARYLQGLGFKALATTSSGFAHAQGLSDGEVTRDMVLAHAREMAQATDVPVNTDFEGGYADDPAEVAANVALCVETGIAGLSIEDFTGNAADPLYGFDVAVARVRAAREAIDKAGDGLVFTARTEGFIHGRPDLDETVRRLKAFADAGADCLYAPGVRDLDEVRTIVQAVAPKPVNVLMAWPGMKVSELAEAGVRRVSVGGALARAAWAAFDRAAEALAAEGAFPG